MMGGGFPDGEIARAASAASVRQNRRKKPPADGGDSEGGEKKKRKPRTPVPSMTAETARMSATTPSRRRLAAAQLKLASYSFREIVEILEYDSVQQAKNDVYKALGETADPEDMKAMRQVLIGQAEKQLQRSMRFASAEVLVDEDDEEYQHYDQLAWHHAAREDMRMMGQLTGAFAPIEVLHKSASTEELEALAAEMLALGGHEVASGDLRDLDIVDVEEVVDGES